MVNSGSKPVARKFVSQSEVSESADFGQKLAPQVGLEATVKRKRKHLQSTDGTESLRKAVVVHGN
jgi:hypothetical protein